MCIPFVVCEVRGRYVVRNASNTTQEYEGSIKRSSKSCFVNLLPSAFRHHLVNLLIHLRNFEQHLIRALIHVVMMHLQQRMKVAHRLLNPLNGDVDPINCFTAVTSAGADCATALGQCLKLHSLHL